MKTLIFFLWFFIAFVNIDYRDAIAENEKPFYAKIQTSGVNFCSSPSEASALFEIPVSYFVEVESVVDDYYKARYDDLWGFVKKEKVSLMDGIPQSPFAAASFRAFVPYYLHQSTSQNSSSLANITPEMTLKFYGSKFGEQVTSTSNLWHYVSVSQGEQTVFGYIFSSLVDPQPKPAQNTETFNVVGEDVLSTPTTEFTSLSVGTKVILIVAIGVPSLLILYFLIKPTKIMQLSKSKKRATKTHRSQRKADYFEFDENEL